ncbi:MAG: hypothetical protein KF775_00080 [Cyclobacteriaceae bacterium]|nr:hypothetical protein [Cyclobacteriaceae bacterium]
MFVSCFKEQTTLTTLHFTGKELLSAILFADGPALEIMPEIKNSVNIAMFLGHDDELEQVRELYGSILDKLEEREPGFFENFKNKIESRNHVIIEATIKIYAARVSMVLKNEYADSYEFKQVLNNRDRFMEIISRYNSLPSNQYTVKNLLDNSDFTHEISMLLDEISDGSITGKLSASEREACVFFVAGLAAWVVIWWAVLAWTFFWTGTNYDWDFDGNYAIIAEGSLLKDQIINSLATNFN